MNRFFRVNFVTKKYGYFVSLHPRKMWTNFGAFPLAILPNFFGLLKRGLNAREARVNQINGLIRLWLE